MNHDVFQALFHASQFAIRILLLGGSNLLETSATLLEQTMYDDWKKESDKKKRNLSFPDRIELSTSSESEELVVGQDEFM